MAGADRRLLRSQKNVAFRLIEAEGLDPRDFEWTERWQGDYAINRHVFEMSVLTQYYVYNGS